ncbi:hypothetical protein GAYE_SCF05G2558 [Galdieria yellowstonensis]|uniref:Prokaryotic-type class I peptide chain release factors domain-containing protein n=1 Tax=Galdieria yellowstonensis TaxID=3028027 RepID=A0AAV9IBI8_9RHOD|nr:hypothetical protein GAYE_SCF05G2558 [Galdieria yellowstonensis]
MRGVVGAFVSFARVVNTIVARFRHSPLCYSSYLQLLTSHSKTSFLRRPPAPFLFTATFCNPSNSSYEEYVLTQQMTKIQAEHKSIEFREQDLEEKFIRGGGPGGQSINKTESCVVLVHKPTGIWVKCQESRSQYRNRQIARQRLKEKIDLYYLGEESKVAQKIAKIRARKANRRKKAIKKHKSKKEQSNEDSVEDILEQDDVWFLPPNPDEDNYY